jgi:pto-interacting protein 1
MGELKKITMNFSNDALIGEGSYNNVYLGVLKDGQSSAIKKPRHTRGTTFKVTAVCCLCYPFSYCSQIITSTTSLSVPPPLPLSLYLCLQVSDISKYKHANVIQLLGYCVEGDNRVLVYEYTSRGSLHDILHGEL